MTTLKEIGGYLSLEGGSHAPPFGDAVYLNSARNALRYIVEACGAREMHVPYYLCPSVWDALRADDVRLYFYDLDERLLPVGPLPETAFLLYVNYFGLCDGNIRRLEKTYPNLIVDNAQAFFAPPRGRASLYSPRKFFGLPDGGLAVCAERVGRPLETDVSYDRCLHLLRRIDASASEAYADFQANEQALEGRPVRCMSALTRHLMTAVDYERARRARRLHFRRLHDALGAWNLLRPALQEDAVPLAYPLMPEAPGLREVFIRHKIYVPTYWPGVERMAPEGSYAARLKELLLPLPVDQRCTEEDMERIIDVFRAQVASCPACG